MAAPFSGESKHPTLNCVISQRLLNRGSLDGYGNHYREREFVNDIGLKVFMYPVSRAVDLLTACASRRASAQLFL